MDLLRLIFRSRWRRRRYRICRDTAKVYAVERTKPPKGWKPDLSGGLDAALPFPWPERYSRKGQNFNPWAFFRNAAALCTHLAATGDDETRRILVALHERLLEHTVARDRRRFVVYRFVSPYRDHYRTAVPWTSAYASGAALIGLTLMAVRAGMPEAMTTAKEVLAGMAGPIDPRRERPHLWVSFVDERGFLWFEEKPLDQVDQPRILNGHIRALTGLYIHWAFTGDRTALKLLRGGIRTIEEYAPAYRVPGGINSYDMLEPRVDDYSPARTISQQEILYRMTGEPVFAAYRDAFKADMGERVAA